MGLMDGLAGWLKQIIAVVLLAALVDLLLPNNTMQRYVRLVAGLFILLTVATPLLQWLQGDFSSRLADGLKNAERSPQGSSAELSRIESEGRRLRERQYTEAADLMAVRLQEAIRSDLERTENRPVKRVQAAVDTRQDGALEVTEIRVTLGAPDSVPATAGEGAESSRPPAQVDPVAPVVVEVEPVLNGRTESNEGKAPDRDTRLRIAGFIAARYGIPADRVQVTQVNEIDG